MHSFSSILSFSFEAISPLLLLVFVGILLRRLGLFSDGFLRSGNQLVFYVLTPSLLFCNIYSIESLSDIPWDAVLFSLFAVFLLFFLGKLLARFVRDPRQKGVIVQCAFRSNNALIGLPLAESLVGSSALADTAAISAFAIPLFNILAVIALCIYIGADGKRPSVKTVVGNILKNPIILGVVFGFVVLFFRTLLQKMPGMEFSLQKNLPFLYSAVQQLGRCASPMALLLLGGGFRFSAVRAAKRQIALGTAARLILGPLVGIGGAIFLSRYLFTFDAEVYAALVALFASPVAVNSAIMAEEMHNDGQLAGQLVVWTSVFSIFTLFFLIALLRGLSLL